jgi:hypothetical protein
MEEQKLIKKGVTYPSKIGNMDYTEYQLNWILKKKLKSKTTEHIEKLKKKYLKYIDAYDNELKLRENESKKKQHEEEEKEKALLAELMKKYNKV